LLNVAALLGTKYSQDSFSKIIKMA